MLGSPGGLWPPHGIKTLFSAARWEGAALLSGHQALRPLPLPRPRSLLCLFHKTVSVKSRGCCMLSGPPQPARRKAEQEGSRPTALAAPRSGRPGCPPRQPWEPTHPGVRGGPQDPPCGPRGPTPGAGGTCSFRVCFLNSLQAEARLTRIAQRGLLTTAVPVLEAPVGPLPSPPSLIGTQPVTGSTGL